MSPPRPRHLRVVSSASAEPPDDASLEGLYRRHAVYVGGLASRLLGRAAEVEDVVQDVFVTAVPGLSRRDAARQTRAWFARVAVERCARELRRRRRWALVDLAADPSYERLALPGADGDERQLLIATYCALDRLPPRLRIPWTLHHVEGEPLEQVAELCGCPRVEAERRIARAYERLRSALRAATPRPGPTLPLDQRLREGPLAVASLFQPARADSIARESLRRRRGRWLRLGATAVCAVGLTGGFAWRALVSDATGTLGERRAPGSDTRALGLANEPVPAEQHPPERARAPPSARTPAERPEQSWREAARRGDYGAAYEQLDQVRAQARPEEPADLLLAADVARLSGHPSGAIAPLRALYTRFPRDERAPVAAFTLGRVLLDELARAEEAAQAFARARELGPAGPLSEDALAREAEAWSHAGRAERAHTTARRYLRRFPHGRHTEAVRRFLIP